MEKHGDGTIKIKTRIVIFMTLMFLISNTGLKPLRMAQ